MSQTILIVEDDAALRRLFRTALSVSGFDVREVGDGYTALHVIEQDPPDGIVLDLGLPIVSERSYPHAACVLRKPITPQRLVNTVRACLIAQPPPGS